MAAKTFPVSVISTRKSFRWGNFSSRFLIYFLLTLGLSIHPAALHHDDPEFLQDQPGSLARSAHLLAGEIHGRELHQDLHRSQITPAALLRQQRISLPSSMLHPRSSPAR